MWTIINKDMPISVDLMSVLPTMLPLSEIFAGSMIPGDLCQIVDKNKIDTIIVPKSTGDTIQISLPNVSQIQSLKIGSVVLNASSFTWDLATHTLTITTPLTPGLSLSVIGVSGQTTPKFLNTSAPISNPDGSLTLAIGAEYGSLATDYVSPALFTVFWGLPITGTISWTRTFEQHPSGSCNLTVLQDGIATVRTRFKKGTELEFAGIGFSVSSYNDQLLNTVEYPGGAYQVAISFTGKWNRRRYNKPVFWLNGSQSLSNISTLTLNDSDCQLGKSPDQIKFTSKQVSVATIALKNNVKLDLCGSLWNITVPNNTPNNGTTTWQQELQDRLRQNNAFVLYSSPQSVKALPLQGTRTWAYFVPEIEVSHQGDYEHTDGTFGYAVEYPKVQLEGLFSTIGTTTSEDTQGQRGANFGWQQKAPIKETIVNGDPDPTNPPEDTTSITSLDVNWDSSGPTKTLDISETEDSMVMKRSQTTYGFALQGSDIYSPTVDLTPAHYYGLPSAYWKPIKQKTEIFQYDSKTGYLLGSQTTGWQLVRFQAETANPPETVTLFNSQDKDDQRMLAIYTIRKSPIQGVSQYVLNQYIDYYNDVQEADTPPLTPYKVCLPDGSSVLHYQEDPTYVKSFFALVYEEHVNTFASMPHPKNTSADSQRQGFVPLNDLTSGEETLNRRYVKILASSSTIGTEKADQNNSLDSSTKVSDRYIEYNSQFSASGPGFQNGAEDTKMSQHEGRPSLATKKPLLYEKIEPQSATPNPSTGTQSGYNYYLTTPGYNMLSPTQGSVSFPYATTLLIAQNAAAADLRIRDAQESVSFSYSVPFDERIQEFDRAVVSTKFDTYRTKILSVSNAVNIQGQSNGFPLCTAPGGTKISAGIDRIIPLTILQTGITTTTFSVTTHDVVLGSIQPVTMPTRRNVVKK